MSSEQDPERNPIIQPRLIRLAQRRPKLVDIEVRDRFLDNLEESVCERRCPPNISDRFSRILARSGEEAVEPVLRNTLRDRLSSANRGLLKRL